MRRSRWIGMGLGCALLGGALVVTQGSSAGAFTGTVAVGVAPQELAVDTRVGHAVVVNTGGDSVSVLDTHSGALVRTVPVVSVPLEVAVDTRTNRAIVVNDQGDVSVLDTGSGAVLRTLNIEPSGGGLALCDVVVATQANRFLVVMGNGATPSILTLLDARTGVVLRQVPVGRYAHTIAVDERTGRVFTANITDSTVSVLALGSGRVLRTVGVRAGPQEVAVDARTGRAFVTDADGSVSVLDTRDGSVVRTIAVGGQPAELNVDATTGRVFVLLNSGVATLDARTGAVLRTVTVGNTPAGVSVHNPQDIVVDARASRVFVTELTNAVSVLDARNGRVLRRLPTGPGPVALALDEAHSRLLAVNLVGGDPRDVRQLPGAGWAWAPHGLRRWLPWLSSSAAPTNTGSVTVLDTAHL